MNPFGPPTNFDGLTSFGVPLLGGQGLPYPIPMSTNTFFVSSVAGGNGNTGTAADPYATVAFVMANKALARGAANPFGTVIVCLPGHAENISAATGINCNVVGVTVISLGIGNQRATFTLDTGNTTSIGVAADGVTWVNCRFKANFLSLATCFLLTTAKWFTLIGNEFFDASGILDFLNIVKSTGAANTIDGVTLTDNLWKSLGTTSMNSMVLSANDIDGAILMRNQVTQNSTVDAAILMTITAGVLTNLLCLNNYGYRKNTTTANGSLINVGGTTSTGVVGDNRVQTLTTTADKLFTTTVGLSAFGNSVTGAVGAQGFPIPALDS